MNVFLDVTDIEEKIIASLHTDLEFDQVNSKGRTVLENRLTDPVVGALIFTNTHVGKSTTERIKVSEGET